MWKVLLGIACLFCFELQAIEYEVQFENDLVSVGKVRIAAQEEIGLHRDAHPQIVVALKGGTMVRLEQDGQEIEVEFPSGVPVFREPDPENQFHRSVNRSNEPMELIIIHLKNDHAVAIDGN